MIGLMINLLFLLFLLLPDGLHWDAVCYTKPEMPNAIIEMMFVPHDSFTNHYARVPDMVVDSMLSYWTRKGADKAGFNCGSMRRHYDQDHIDYAERWATQYEPNLGYFKINIRSLVQPSLIKLESLDSGGPMPYINPTEGDT